MRPVAFLMPALVITLLTTGCLDGHSRVPLIRTAKRAETAVRRPVAPPAVFRPVIRAARRAGISVLLPTVLPFPPFPDYTWSLANFSLDRREYSFSLVATAKTLPLNSPGIPEPGAGYVFTMSTVSGPPAPYPSQLLAEPSGTARLSPDVTADSYGQGMMLRWKKGGWTYTAVGHFAGTALPIARQILAALGSDPRAVPGSRGELTVSQTGSPMYSDACWTYGRRWFAITGLSGPGRRIAELRFLVREALRKPKSSDRNLRTPRSPSTPSPSAPS